MSSTDTEPITFGMYSRTLYPLEIENTLTRTAIYSVGSPDQGKSTLLGNLAEQFCGAGEGVLVLDVKGDLARDIAHRTRYPERTVYVKMGEILFPGNDRRMWTLNPFDGHRVSENRRKQLEVSILESFERMGLAQLGSMANIRGTLGSAIRMAMALPEPTYLDVLLIVVSKEYRQWLLGTFRHIDHITRKHWVDLDDSRVTTVYMRRNEINTSRNRLETLLYGSDFNLPAGHYQSTLKLRQWLDEGKMILVDLGLPLVWETGVDLGNMIMAQLITEIFLRDPSERERRWRIIADEFHNFVGSTFSQIISAARSYNVFPVLAHQDFGQLPPQQESTIRGSVGHAGIQLNFKGSRYDRVSLAAQFGQENVDQFFMLKQHTALISYMSSLTGSYEREVIRLHDWWGDPVPGQFAELQMAAHPHTVSVNDLVESNRRKYWDHLDGGGIRDTRKSDADRHKDHTKPRTPAKAGAPPPDRKRSSPGQAPEPGRDSGSRNGHSHPGVPRPPRDDDQRDAPGPALPRPPRPKK